MADTRPLRTYGRIKARVLKPRQAALVETLLPHLAVPEEGALDVEQLFSPPLAGGAGGGVTAVFSPDGLRPLPHPLPPPARGGETVLEIGFGGGEHLVAQAQAHPDARFIGVEPFLNGVASCLRHIEESGAQNIRLHMGDARDVLARLPDASLDLCYILFPDPWPKLRHHKRRLIQPDFLDELARTLKPGGELRFATDWANYAAWTLEHFTRDARFAWLAERAADWRAPWAGHVPTRYEQKRLGDCAPVWLRFTRGPGMQARLISADEAAIVRSLLRLFGRLDDRLDSQIDAARVVSMADGGMGSIRFLSNKPNQAFGSEAARGIARDIDDVSLDMALNLDTDGDLFELDIWRVDFSPLQRYPAPDDIQPAPER